MHRRTTALVLCLAASFSLHVYATTPQTQPTLSTPQPVIEATSAYFSVQVIGQ